MPWLSQRTVGCSLLTDPHRMIKSKANTTDREKDWYFLSVLVEVHEEKKQAMAEKCYVKKWERNIGCSVSPLYP